MDLVAIDSLSCFLPGGSENLAPLMLEMLAPLRRLTERRMAVLLLHHPRKETPAEGMAARGSGALSAYADIIVEMDCCRRSRPGNDRRRALAAFSRFDDTPRDLVIELNAAGTDYEARGEAAHDEFLDCWSRLHAVLLAARGKLTRRELAASWPDADGPPPAEASLGPLPESRPGPRPAPLRRRRYERIPPALLAARGGRTLEPRPDLPPPGGGPAAARTTGPGLDTRRRA